MSYRPWRCAAPTLILPVLLMMLAPLAMAQPEPATDPQTVNSSQYAELANTLEDPTRRRQLIAQLRALEAMDGAPLAGVEGEVPAAEIAAQAPSGQTAGQVSLARRMAATTATLMADMWRQLTALSGLLAAFSGTEAAAAPTAPGDNALPDMEVQTITAALLNLAILAGATFVVFWLLRLMAGRLFSRLSRWARRGSKKLAMVRTVAAVGVAALLDTLAVSLAYLAGNGLIAVLAAQWNADETRLALFLNAFLIVELVKAGLRMVFSSRYDGLRLLQIQAGPARYCNAFLARQAGLIGYGMLVLVPVLNFNVSPALGSGVGVAIMLLALIYATTVIVTRRGALRASLARHAQAATGPQRMALLLLSKTWHWLALGYALLVFAVTVLDPQQALPYVAFATLETLVYVGIGGLVSVVIAQLIGRQIHLPASVNESLPHLQSRLNTYIPGGLKIMRVLILALVVIAALDAWELYDLAAWYATPGGAQTVSAVLDILIIVTLAAATWIGLASLIEHKLAPGKRMTAAQADRAETLLGLFHSTLAITIVIMTVMIVLSEIGVDIGPLIAGAGVLGLAIGFGAQKLVQDVITGVFIQLENAMNTNDYVTAGSHSGTVERVGIRSVALRDLYGTYHIVPFSSVDAVSNYTRDYGNHVGEYGIAYRENIDDAIVQLEAAFEALKEGEFKNDILAPMTVAGVSALADSSVNIRVVIETTPGNQWAVGRAYNRLVKMYFDKAGIEIPFPHTTLYFGEDREGRAPAAAVKLTDERVVATQTGSG